MTLSGYVYHASAGETFDSVALKVYGDEKYAAELLCANVTLCEKMEFTGGEELKIPVVAITTEETGQKIGAAPWKE